jgi:hypothetical protein
MQIIDRLLGLAKSRRASAPIVVRSSNEGSHELLAERHASRELLPPISGDVPPNEASRQAIRLELASDLPAPPLEMISRRAAALLVTRRDATVVAPLQIIRGAGHLTSWLSGRGTRPHTGYFIVHGPLQPIVRGHCCLQQ